jgi:hypothetical protein
VSPTALVVVAVPLDAGAGAETLEACAGLLYLREQGMYRSWLFVVSHHMSLQEKELGMWQYKASLYMKIAFIYSVRG